MKRLIVITVSACLLYTGSASAESRPPPDFSLPPPDMNFMEAGPPPDLYPTKEGGFICDVYFTDWSPWPDLYPKPDVLLPDTTYQGAEHTSLHDDVISVDIATGQKDAGVGGDGGPNIADDDDGGCAVAGHTSGPSALAALFMLLFALRRRG